MPDEEQIHPTIEAHTRKTLAEDLLQLGMRAGMTVIVHSSLRSLGWVNGGPTAVVQALMDVITETGTIIMPTQTGNYSDPAQWQNPPVPQMYLQTLYDTIPAFDPHTSASFLMGKIVETFRVWPGVRRSNHPTVSFAAWGRHAQAITGEHPLDYGLGDSSPLARIYDLEGWVLLLGVGYERNTSFHLAEYRIPEATPTTLGSPILVDGQRIWKWYKDIDIDSQIFPEIGLALEQTGIVNIDTVGSATARLFPQRPAIDFAVQWLRRTREG